MCFGKDKVKAKMREIELEGNQAQNKDKEMYPVLELVLEMYERGLKFLDIDLYKSHSTKFLVEEDGIRPPLNSIPGLGEVAAEGIYKTVPEETFDCIDELQEKSGYYEIYPQTKIIDVTDCKNVEESVEMVLENMKETIVNGI